MRTTAFFSTLLIIVFMVGCTEQSAPTEVSDDMSSDVVVKLHKGQPMVFEDVPFGPFQAINPCTGLPHDQFGTFDLRIHEFVLNEDGDHHINGSYRFDVETSDGYSGTVVQAAVDNGMGVAGSPDEEYSYSVAFNIRFRNEDGQQIRQHSNYHITIRDGEILSFIFNNKGATCVGIPDN